MIGMLMKFHLAVCNRLDAGCKSRQVLNSLAHTFGRIVVVSEVPFSTQNLALDSQVRSPSFRFNTFSKKKVQSWDSKNFCLYSARK